MVDDLPGHFGGVDLDHRHFVARFLAAVDLPGGVVGHQPAGMDLGGGVGDPPLHGLAFGQRQPEGDALGGVFDHHVQCPLRHPGAPGGHLHATGGKPLLHRREAIAFTPQQLGCRNAAILERQFIGVGAAEHGNTTQHVEPGRALVQQKGGDPAARALGLVGHGHQDGEVGVAHPADPDLAAVDHPVVAVTHRAGHHAGRIAPRAGLRDRDGGGEFAARIGFQVLRLLLLVAGVHEHAQVRAVGRQGIGGDRLAFLLFDPNHGHHRQVRAAEFRRCVEAPQAEFLGAGVDRRDFFRRQPVAVAGGLAGQHGVFQRHQLVLDEPGHQVLDHPVFFAEFEIHLLPPFSSSVAGLSEVLPKASVPRLPPAPRQAARLTHCPSSIRSNEDRGFGGSNSIGEETRK